MAIKLSNLSGTLLAFIRNLGSSAVPGAGEGILSTHLEDLNGNPLAMLEGSPVNAAQYGVPNVIVNDENVVMMRGDRTGGVAVATIQPLISWLVEGATLNSRVLYTLLNTQTAVQTVQGLTLNASNLTTINTNAQINTFKMIPVHMKAPLMIRLRAKFTQFGVANTNGEFGLATVATPLGLTANLNGAYWRLDSAGVMPVLAINGVVIAVGTNISAQLSNTNFYHWGVLKDDDSISFTCQNTTTGQLVARQTLRIPAGQQKMFNVSHVQPYVRVWNAAVAPTFGCQCVMSELTAGMLDCNFNLTAPQIATSIGLGSEQGPTNYTTTSNLLNSAVAPTTIPSNATATATTLDGAIRMAAPAGGVTDLALFTYQVPAPYQYRNKRVRVSVKNLGAAVATTATQIDFYLCVNSPGVTLVGSLNRKHIGTQTFPVGSAIGSAAFEGPIELNLSEADMITEAGRYNILVARISTGTATASQVLEIHYTNLGHFE